MRYLTGMKACHQNIAFFSAVVYVFKASFLSPLFKFVSVNISYICVHLPLTSGKSFISITSLLLKLCGCVYFT